jgi:hypothetical protein
MDLIERKQMSFDWQLEGEKHTKGNETIHIMQID